MLVIFWVAFVFFLILIGPMLIIWSLNTLFPVLNITYGLDTWLAVVLLCSVIRSSFTVDKKP